MALFSLIGANKICSITTPIGMRFMPVSPLTLKAKLVSIPFSSIKFWE